MLDGNSDIMTRDTFYIVLILIGENKMHPFENSKGCIQSFRSNRAKSQLNGFNDQKNYGDNEIVDCNYE